jgi:RNA-binding protein
MTPTSTLSSSARRALRAAAHHLDPVVMMGQHGLTPAVLHEIDLALTAHALIKVRAGSDERETREAYLTEICAKLGCESVQHLGKLFVLWRNADGAADADESAEQDAAAVASASRPRDSATPARGPRSKLPGERAAARAPAPRGQYAPRREDDAPAGARAASRGSQTGERRRWGDAPPEPPRREGWAPKDRRGAARFADNGSGDARRPGGRTGNTGGTGGAYGAPRGRAPAATGGSDGYRGDTPRGAGGPPAGRGGYSSGGYGGRFNNDRNSEGSGDQGSDAARSRWGDRRPPQGGGYQGGTEGNGRFGDDRGAPKQRSAFGRNADTGAARPPRGRSGFSGGSDSGAAGGRGGWGSRDGSRDGFTGKPSGFSRGGAGGTGGRGDAGPPGAKPRARRRMG